MNKVLRNTLIVIAILVLAAGVFFAGSLSARVTGSGFAGMMSGFGWNNASSRSYGSGMMGNGATGMMNGGNGYGFGMMGGSGNNNANVTPLTADEAKAAAEKYLATLDNADLKIAEVMIFNNNAYVRVIEQSTGIGAFELLVDPVSKVAFPEYGANMMWNLKYSTMNHSQMMGGSTGTVRGNGMMGGNGGGMMGYSTTNSTPAVVSADMPITAAQALQTAQRYLDSALPGTKTATDVDPFYGYYTIDILRDGKTIGMLSVNGYSGQIFLHTWHGTFIEEKTY
jgi:hypothetical protein